MPNARRIISGFSMKLELSPEMTERVIAIARANKEDPGEMLQKAITVYEAAVKAKGEGRSVGVAAREALLENVWKI
jgi:predicted transcriptional regulator